MSERSDNQQGEVLTLQELVEGWLRLVDMGEETAVARIVQTLQLDSYSKPSRDQVRQFVVEHVLAVEDNGSNGRG